MKERFILLLSETKRNGIGELLDYLENDTDFYTAPASSNYHGNYEKGLLEHSLLVYDNLINLSRVYECNIPIESLTIISLLHDVCKINFYKISKRNRKKKDEKGNDIYDKKGKFIWFEENYYSIEDNFPLGHGEKSVIMLQKFITLTNNEIMGIRWHMMSYDDVVKGYAGNLALTNALNLYPIISLIHCADLLSISQKIKIQEIKPDINFMCFETNEDLIKDCF